MFHRLYRKYACEFITSKLTDQYLLVRTAMPFTLVSEHFMGSYGEDDQDDDFDTMHGDGDASCAKDKPVKPVKPPQAIVCQQLVCFRVLKSNPSAAKVLPNAPRINDYTSFVAVTEHLAASGISGAKHDDMTGRRVSVAQTERDIDERTVIISPSTFTYEEMHTMKRAVMSTTPVHEIVGAEHVVDFNSEAALVVMQGLLLTYGIGTGRCYVVDRSSKRRDEQLDVLHQLSGLKLVTLEREIGDESHWLLTRRGSDQLQMSFALVDHEPMQNPLSSSVRLPS